MAKKKPKKRRDPPLSLLDKTVYIGSMLLSFAILALLLLCGYRVKRTVIFQDPTLLACNDSGVSVLWILPFFCFLGISIIVFIAKGLTFRDPIFGNKAIRYGEYPWKPNCYPLLDPRRKRVPVKPSKKRLQRKMLLIWCAVLLVLTCLIPFGLLARDCLYEDHSITAYNAFNQPTNVYTKDDLTHLTVGISLHSSSIHNNFIIRKLAGNAHPYIRIDTKDGRSFRFSLGNFADGDALDEICKLKESFSPQDVTLSNEELLDKAISDMNLTEAQAQALRDLFDAAR